MFDTCPIFLYHLVSFQMWIPGKVFGVCHSQFHFEKVVQDVLLWLKSVSHQWKLSPFRGQRYFWLVVKCYSSDSYSWPSRWVTAYNRRTHHVLQFKYFHSSCYTECQTWNVSATDWFHTHPRIGFSNRWPHSFQWFIESYLSPESVPITTWTSINFSNDPVPTKWH